MDDAKLINMGEEAFKRTQKMNPQLIRNQLYEYYLKTIREFNCIENHNNDRIETFKQKYNTILRETKLENIDELSSYLL